MLGNPYFNQNFSLLTPTMPRASSSIGGSKRNTHASRVSELFWRINNDIREEEEEDEDQKQMQ